MRLRCHKVTVSVRRLDHRVIACGTGAKSLKRPDDLMAGFRPDVPMTAEPNDPVAAQPNDMKLMTDDQIPWD